MPGIAGFVSSERKISANVAEGILNGIKYRGKDSFLKYEDNQCCILQTCTEASSVRQHPVISDATGCYHIVSDGSIYNSIEIKRELETHGHIFRSGCDSEVILEGYKRFGERICRYLNGMFAFAIWNSREKSLFLAKDHLGKKPLFWTVIPGFFCFSSSIISFFNLPYWKGEINQDVLELQPRMGTFGLSTTIFDNVYALPAGCHAVISLADKKPAIVQYWTPHFTPKLKISEGEALEALEEMLLDAIRIRCPEIIQAGMSFSGGVDSGLIAALAVRKLGISPKCFCIDYDTPEDRSEETKIAEQVASHLGLDIQKIHFDYKKNLLPWLESSLENFDMPTTQISCVYCLKLYEIISNYTNIILTGNGGDELFAGYTGNEEQLRSDLNYKWSFIPKEFLKFIPSSICERYSIINDFPKFFSGLYINPSSSDIQKNIADEMRSLMELCGVNSNMDILMFNGLYTSSSQGNYILPDVIGSQYAVESRSPLLDYRLVEFAAKLPDHYKIHDPLTSQENKWILKKLYEKYVPKEIVWSKKKGMGWNIRYDISFASDPQFISRANKYFEDMCQNNLKFFSYKKDLEQYINEKTIQKKFATAAGCRAVTAFMQSAWLVQKMKTKNIHIK